MLRFTLASLLIAGCVDSPSDPKEPLEPASPAERFSTEVGHSYSFEWQRSCECSPDWTRAIRIDVIRDEIVNAFFVDTGEPVSVELRDDLKTIAQVFDTIEAAYAEGAAAVDVQYDAALGFPSSVAVDYSTEIADEEFSLRISGVAPIGGPGCGGAPE